MIEAYFSNIEQQIVKMLSTAEHQVLVAVAWFTNETLYEELLKCLGRGVPTSVIIMDDYINRNEFALDFTKFIETGGTLYFSKEKKMHNKFCIIIIPWLQAAIIGHITQKNWIVRMLLL